MFTDFSQNYWHSPIDSANNACYITCRTKEKKSSFSLKGDMTYDDA